jgi:hypothetical protein
MERVAAGVRQPDTDVIVVRADGDILSLERGVSAFE